jgi:RNA polymerase sigma factor (sigma-70 family)
VPLGHDDDRAVKRERRFAVDASRVSLDKRFHELLTANGPALSRLAASYANSPNDRDDLFQDIALAIWQALPRFRGECSERTFIFRIAHNRALTHISKRRPATAIEDSFDVPDPKPTPERDLFKDQLQTRLFDAIHRLPIAYRQVITLVLEDMAYADIAVVLGISESNVGARLSRARQALRELLERYQ